ncbi:two-component system, sensor histidine kinase YesM [Anaerocolumna jejuensis DSM 15929]|uniref:histidine kinase n=1 Tax=Anaerocolumna jejuensis DSM 15929 TaxID=1121322 RepID=A0A1M6KCM5_9FIRM|nr:histidine kinase [Anaerocolumna jejuensis]SHJ56716.1 two-component system, sensor histidine kinase YesM [Anaerocolumna jejuensis DSM 15929]
MVKIHMERILYLSLRTKLGIILAVFAIIPSFVIYSQVMKTYEADMVDVASQNVQSIVKTNNNLINTTLSRIEDASYLLLNNKDCFDCFSKIDTFTVSDFLKEDRVISDVLGKQFAANNTVYAKYIYTSKWIFDVNNTSMKPTIKEIQGFKLDKKAARSGGQVLWITSYDYGKWFQTEYLSKKRNYNYQYPITMVRLMNFQYSQNGKLYAMKNDQERPVLVVHVLESTLSSLYKSSVNYNGSIYGVVNEEGRIISSDNKLFPITSLVPEQILKLKASSGYTSCWINHVEYLLCYDDMEERNWFSFCLIPMTEVIRTTKELMQNSQRWITMVLLAASVLIAALLSSTISRPIAALTKAAERVSTGDFRADTPEPRGKDFKILTRTFNHMEKEITRLIDENYKISLREKDTQIMALTMQINPHFLYNTLNTINMMAIINDDSLTSDLIVSLSEMLHYSFRNTDEKIPLSDEVQWTLNYINIMSRRFEGVFETIIGIPDELMVFKVPKFFLQPIVENSILHGFEGMSGGGILRLSAEKLGDFIVFTVSDNGKGMKITDFGEVTQMQESGIGLSNVRRRLSLIYGENYSIDLQSEPGIGTTLYLTIPCQN